MGLDIKISNLVSKVANLSKVRFEAINSLMCKSVFVGNGENYKLSSFQMKYFYSVKTRIQVGLYAIILNNRGNLIYHPRLRPLPELEQTYTSRFAEVEVCKGS